MGVCGTFINLHLVTFLVGYNTPTCNLRICRWKRRKRGNSCHNGLKNSSEFSVRFTFLQSRNCSSLRLRSMVVQVVNPMLVHLNVWSLDHAKSPCFSTTGQQLTSRLSMACHSPSWFFWEKQVEKLRVLLNRHGEVSSRRSRDSLLADLDSIEASWKTTGENFMSRSSVEVILLHIHQDPLGSSKYPIKWAFPMRLNLSVNQLRCLPVHAWL